MVAAAKPNILLFLTDDHAQWALGCYGNREIRTPALDYLASRGVRMGNAFTPTPVCSPARACLLSGRYASQHGIHDYLGSGNPEINSIQRMADEITLAQLLQAAGYQTALSGKWHLGQDEFPQPGYDYWFTLGRKYPVPHEGPVEYGVDGEHQLRTGRISDVITDQALAFLRQMDAARPFFLQVGYYATHSPWAGHAEWLVDSYRRATFADIPADETYPFGRQNLESRNETRFNPREALAQYYAAVSEIDTAVGRLLDDLEATGRLNNTIIIYTSDHGLNCGHHGIWGKGNGTLPLNMVEESIRVPLIFYGPDHLFAGQVRGEMVDHLDTFQTILAMAGVSPPERRYAGRSLWPLLQETGERQPWRQRQFGEYGNVRMVRTDRHKLVRREPAGPHELFDLTNDPRERQNLFADPTCQTIVTELSQAITAHFNHYEDPQKSGLNVRNQPRHNFTEAWREGGNTP
ncbi:MAG: sulfatase-like hydrolase/transferase [Anaerolineales bacterium]|nr:sulfatase-like hydrolase/transferase [Anaerolineales bacterium]MCB0008243.1 sulfatase-like hydrolase/transferase [Anaerolineales bacterium]MCB0017811.1 sulfatase-like hydrolase/transferase [Anaerolineales bacterium]MCB8959219.1 sulfatase-like hydrolase/transferase [Ardenticatenales bacterium]